MTAMDLQSSVSSTVTFSSIQLVFPTPSTIRFVNGVLGLPPPAFHSAFASIIVVIHSFILIPW